jgi:hypothetical protein
MSNGSLVKHLPSQPIFVSDTLVARENAIVGGDLTVKGNVFKKAYGYAIGAGTDVPNLLRPITFNNEHPVDVSPYILSGPFITAALSMPAASGVTQTANSWTFIEGGVWQIVTRMAVANGTVDAGYNFGFLMGTQLLELSAITRVAANLQSTDTTPLIVKIPANTTVKFYLLATSDQYPLSADVSITLTCVRLGQ